MRVKSIAESEAARKVEIDGDCRFTMPLVQCPVCKERLGVPAASFPALFVPKHIEKYVEPTEDLNPRPFEEYEMVRDEILEANNRKDLVLPPVSGVGRHEAKLLVGKPHDFAWDGPWAPLLSKDALERLASRNVHLTAGELRLTKRGVPVETHVALQCELAPLMSEATVKALTLEKCSFCGEYKQEKMGVTLDNCGRCEFVKELLPTGKHLVRLLGWETYIVASEEFVEAVESLGLTGIRFEDIGEWI